jgi:hypothetical protein
VNEHQQRDLSSILRRTNFLRMELYNYEKFFRNPQNETDIATHAKWAVDADDYQRELDQLDYLLGLHDKLTRPATVAPWQLVIILVSVTLAIIVASIALYVTLAAS